MPDGESDVLARLEMKHKIRKINSICLKTLTKGLSSQIQMVLEVFLGTAKINLKRGELIFFSEVYAICNHEIMRSLPTLKGVLKMLTSIF